MINRYLALISYSSILLYYFLRLRDFMKFGEVLTLSQKSIYSAEISIMDKYRNYYFTLWNFILQIIFLLLSIINESSELASIKTFQVPLNRIRSLLFYGLVFPGTLVVTSTFWTIWNIDEGLILPRDVVQYFPPVLNHTLHTLIIIPLVIQTLLEKKNEMVLFRKVAPLLVTYILAYAFVYIFIYSQQGVWLYPFFNVLNWPQRIGYGIFNVILALTYQKIGLSLQKVRKTNNQEQEFRKVE
ncbi:unnamed protein product [Phaedon cochleariae]|uniref:Androgen-dependent TFPI-regulating protein n=1 Tax=Phaedon cochleariae TaxID=80249 RepID=A0A9P0DM81_PHACE|nr:unnamed protein product [Phaedon cochleariae]